MPSAPDARLVSTLLDLSCLALNAYYLRIEPAAAASYVFKNQSMKVGGGGRGHSCHAEAYDIDARNAE